ncbi:HAD family hydrolase [Azohydromonas aeria]|uniref:HAD family hydrolase n=1 Tax=Azohydromonas aeria TaxID=2590212 RepID=UPI0012FC834C|nr:HAD-IA family hydrolase [Azohydromonas aeria]
MTPISFDAVIFDCDGTLVDSEPILAATVREQALALGVAPALLEDLHAMKGQSMALTLSLIARRWGRPLPADFEATVRARMAEVFQERLQPMPGAQALLRRLRLPCCVATNGPRAKTELTLALTGLLPLLRPDRIFSAYDVGAFKPDPALFLHAARALGVAPGRCAVVEDSESGVRAGLAAGMQVHVLRSAQPLPAPLHERVRHLDTLEALID